MSNVIQFPRRETVPQGPAGPLDRRNAWWVENCGDFGRDPDGNLTDEAALALLREQGEREAAAGVYDDDEPDTNYDPDCDCPACRGERR